MVENCGEVLTVHSSTPETLSQLRFNESQLEMTRGEQPPPPNRPSGDSLSIDIAK